MRSATDQERGAGDLTQGRERLRAPTGDFRPGTEADVFDPADGGRVLSSRQVTLLNDTVTYNQRYRSGLISRLEVEGFGTRSVGLFEGGRLSLAKLLKVARTSDPVVSSNLRTNLIVLSIPWLRGLVILNGLGRYRRRKLLRLVLLSLVRANRGKAVAVQSYADFRYLRRHAGGPRLNWVPGSGGTARQAGAGRCMVAVQRDDKLPLVAPDLRALLSALDGARRLRIVGCRDHDATRQLLAPQPVESIGFVDPDALFRHSATFVQPAGYGEGFPHTLADAIASGMEIYISRREYIRCGLWRLGAGCEPLVQGWGRLTGGSELRAATTVETVSAAYLQLLRSAID